MYWASILTYEISVVQVFKLKKRFELSNKFKLIVIFEKMVFFYQSSTVNEIFNIYETIIYTDITPVELPVSENQSNGKNFSN